MQGYTLWLVVGATALAGLLIIGFIFARLYKRASAERSFVRTGLGGQRVIMSGGAVVLPIFHETIAINMNAPFFLSQAAIPHLLETNGAIVNCASSAALIGEAYAAAYCASKAGIVNMTKAMAMEYSRKPIRINAVAPGGMITNIANGMTMPEGVEYDLVQRFSGLRGTVEVDDVANLFAMLASPAGRSYHGACISIDAGITAG